MGIRRLVFQSFAAASWLAAPIVASLGKIVLRTSRDQVLILPAADPGSFGDEAMLRGLVGQVASHDPRSSCHELVVLRFKSLGNEKMIGARAGPSVISRFGGLAILKELWRSRKLYVIGADTLDGRYSEERSVTRLRTASLAARAGADSVILSFSLNRSPTPSVCRAFTLMDSRVQLVARDPLSAVRTERIVGRPVKSAADLAFLIAPTRPERDVLPPGRTKLGFVPNALFAEQFGGPEAYVSRVAECLRAVLEHDEEIGVVVLPHDTRGTPSDFDCARSIVEILPPGRAVAASHVRGPGDVRWITSRLDALVSCRMHAAIAGLAEETPVMILGYQDKAEGMMELFGLDRWVVDPQVALGSPEVFLHHVTDLLGKRDVIRHQIHTHLPDVLKTAASW